MSYTPEHEHPLLPGYHETRRIPERMPENERVFAHVDKLIDYTAIEEQAYELIEHHIAPEKKITTQEYEDNARTAIFEAITRSGHLSRIEFEGDVEVVHQQVLTRLLNGFDPLLPAAERERRFREICEELVIQEIIRMVVRGELPDDVQVNTLSDFATSLGPQADAYGYRSENRKGMNRSTWLEKTPDGTYIRVLEQASRSNSDAHETILMLHGEGVAVARKGSVDADVLATQTVSFHREAGKGALGIMRRLDAYAGPNIMYGEPKQSDAIPYDNLRAVSAERERRVEGHVDTLARFEQTLDERQKRGEITQRQWEQLYRAQVTQIVRAICVMDPTYTEAALGKQVEEAYQRAHERHLRGDTGGADAIISSVAAIENAIVICGGSDVKQSNQQNTDPSITSTKTLLEQSKKWKFTEGKCRVTLCPTGGKKTEVGPCDVCKGCQSYYDDNKDPAREYKKRMAEQARNEAWSFSTSSKQAVTKQDRIAAKYGAAAEVRLARNLGGAEKLIVNRFTDEVIAKV